MLYALLIVLVVYVCYFGCLCCCVAGFAVAVLGWWFWVYVSLLTLRCDLGVICMSLVFRCFALRYCGVAVLIVLDMFVAM